MMAHRLFRRVWAVRAPAVAGIGRIRRFRGGGAIGGPAAPPLPNAGAPPTEPAPEECCGNDCRDCVWTEYWAALTAYQDRVRAIAAATAPTSQTAAAAAAVQPAAEPAGGAAAMAPTAAPSAVVR